MVIRFGAFEIDANQGLLLQDGAPVKLRNQSFRVLLALAERAGEPVTAEELRRVVWGDHIFVDFEQGLRSCVKEIRACLGDSVLQPSFVKTLPRVGYLFLQGVERLEGAVEPAEAQRRRSNVTPFASREEPPLASV